MSVIGQQYEGKDLQKSPLHIRRRHHAGFPLSKPAVAVTGHPVIDGIPEKFGNNNKTVQHRPDTGQTPNDLQGYVRMGIKAPPVVKDHRTEFIDREAGLGGQFLPYFALEGCKAENSLRIVPDDKLDKSIAEIAYSVK